MNRRGFVTSLAAAGSLAQAQEPVKVGVIGAGGRGRLLTGEFKEMGARVTAVSDVYEPNLQAGQKAASPGAQTHADYRRLLDDKSIEAVIVTTPDHWHARMVIDAVEAGKDVYVEKPMAHTIDEGYAVVKAVRRTKRIVQVGTQRRSMELFLEAKQIFDSGRLGEVRLVTSQWMNNQSSLRTTPLSGTLDWKQWLGSAPSRPVDALRFFNWYWYWDYSGGMLIGQAAHVIDAIQWFLRSPEPTAVTCVGTRPVLAGVDIPETATMAIEYPDNRLVTFTLGYKAMRYALFNDQWKQFHGDKARFDVGREWYQLYPQSNALDMKPVEEKKRPGSFNVATAAHVRNFLECVRSRQEPNAPVEAGQATNLTLCLAMQSLREARRVRWDAQARKVLA